MNGPPPDLQGDDLRKCARLLAQYGVNLVRVHGALFDKNGEADLAKLRHAQKIVAAMKAEGIYTHFSIWTFTEANLPDPQLRLLEKQFSDWLVKRHGSLENAFAAWKSPKLKRDTPAEGRVAFRPLWNSANEKSARDQDTAAFLGEVQTAFYRGTRAQGASGNLGAAGVIELPALTLASDLDLAHIIAVPLDNQPLATSGKILLQVMSEEQSSDFATEPAGAGTVRITNPGRDPWQVKKLRGTVSFKRADASQLKVTALNFNGRPAGDAGPASNLKLQPKTLYYLISR